MERGEIKEMELEHPLSLSPPSLLSFSLTRETTWPLFYRDAYMRKAISHGSQVRP